MTTSPQNNENIADQQPYLVFNCEPANADMVTAMDVHERERIAEHSNIVAVRTPLNRILHGSPKGPAVALSEFYKTRKIQPPSRRARTPFIRIVLGASASYFRPENPDFIGTWDDARLEAWLDVAMEALKVTFGDDLVHVSLHLDEDTPHLHILVAPTYLRKPRAIDRRKKGETDVAFASRKAAVAAAPGVRTVGRASHPTLSLKGSIATLRAAFGRAFACLGIHPGHPRSPDDPKPKTTRQWVNDKAAQLKVREAELEAAFAEIAVLKEAAIRDAYAAAPAWHAAVVADLQQQVDDMRDLLGRFLRPLRDLRSDASAEKELMARIRTALKEAPETKIATLRTAIQRAEMKNYHGGQLGAMQRSSDAELLRPWQQFIASAAGSVELDGVAVPDILSPVVPPDAYPEDDHVMDDMEHGLR